MTVRNVVLAESPQAAAVAINKAASPSRHNGDTPVYISWVCGDEGRADRMTLSPHTGNRYCACDVDVCRARRDRKVKRAKKVAA